MGDRDDLNGIVAKDVHEAERVAGKYVPARAAAVARPR
jgi:hypothetical protein